MSEKKGKDQADKRRLNPAENVDAPKPAEHEHQDQHQDAAKRLGNYSTPGEHSRSGTRGK